MTCAFRHVPQWHIRNKWFLGIWYRKNICQKMHWRTKLHNNREVTHTRVHACTMEKNVTEPALVYSNRTIDTSLKAARAPGVDTNIQNSGHSCTGSPGDELLLSTYSYWDGNSPLQDSYKIYCNEWGPVNSQSVGAREIKLYVSWLPSTTTTTTTTIIASYYSPSNSPLTPKGSL